MKRGRAFIILLLVAMGGLAPSPSHAEKPEVIDLDREVQVIENAAQREAVRLRIEQARLASDMVIGHAYLQEVEARIRQNEGSLADARWKAERVEQIRREHPVLTFLGYPGLAIFGAQEIFLTNRALGEVHELRLESISLRQSLREIEEHMLRNERSLVKAVKEAGSAL